MTDGIAHCPVHDTAFEDRCPICGAAGDRLLSGDRRRRLSKFLSGALRHFPDDAGIDLDGAGWARFEAVVDCVERRYDWADGRAVEGIVATDPKGRFETRSSDGRELRAAYGHSVDVDLDRDGGDESDDRPDVLYHGTAPRNLEAIAAEGLRPMDRRAVHLSGSRDVAREVGRRHVDGGERPVVLRVDVAALVDAGFAVRKRGRETFTVTRVPPRFVARDAE